MGVTLDLSREPAIPAAGGDLLISHEQHQCLDHSADQVWGVVHDVGRDAVGKSHRVSPLHWVIGQSYLVTGRREPLPLRAFLQQGAGALTETWSYLLVP